MFEPVSVVILSIVTVFVSPSVSIVVSISALSFALAPIFPALSVIVALTVIVFPSPGEANEVVTFPFVISVAVITIGVVVVPSVTFTVSPASTPAGRSISTSTLPDNSEVLISPSLFVSSLIFTVGDRGAVVSIITSLVAIGPSLLVEFTTFIFTVFVLVNPISS